MKKTLTILFLVSTVLLVLALSSFDYQDSPTPTYVTVAYSTSYGRTVFIYYGSQTKREEVEIKRGENPNDKILDVLNELSKNGFELISSGTHAFNLNLNKDQGISTSSEGNYIEFYYTLKKR